MTTEQLIWLIPLPPLLAFFVIVLYTNRYRALSHTVAISAALLSWAGSMLVFFRALQVDHFGEGEHVFTSSIPWLPTGSGSLNIGVLIDPLSAATLFFVAWTVLMIFIYSVGYHNFGAPRGDHDQKGLPPHGATVSAHGHKHLVPSLEPMYSRFFAFISLFAFGMYTLVVSDNLLTLFVGWEIMGLCSYLLIGFWYSKPSARAAALKAFLTTRIGDVFMLLGIAYLYSKMGELQNGPGTLAFRQIFTEETLHALASEPAIGGFLGLTAAGLIGLLLFIGTVGKSAQWPLHVWLPDAMEGPTPVSAMIHAATMVSAGVYMVIRMFPLLSAGWVEGGPLTTTLVVMSFIGAFTAIFAATIALAQNDIKRVLAYSTISQLGYMIAALGIGAYVAAVFHLITHAFFKALLFLGSGSVIHGMEHGVLHTAGEQQPAGPAPTQPGVHMEGEVRVTGQPHTGAHIDPQDMFNMGGLSKKMPVTFWTFLIGGLALSGFPLVTAGFWSKDEILADAFAHHHWLVFGTLALAALLTAFYTGRQITLTFLGQPRTEAAEHATENKWTMTLPLAVLSVFAIAAGWVGIPEDFLGLHIWPENWFHAFVGGTLLEHPAAVTFNWMPLLTSVFVSLLGLAGGYLVYRNVQAGEIDPLQRVLSGLYKPLQNKWYFDEIYNATVVRFSNWLAGAAELIDRAVIDGFLHAFAGVMPVIGTTLRATIDRFVNWTGDFVGEGIKWLGRRFRFVQTGEVQQYMLMALVLAFGGLFYVLFAWLRP